MPLDCCGVDSILSQGGTILGTCNIGHYAGILTQETIQRSKENFQKLGLECLVVIGGDGTMSIAYQLTQAGIPCVGVPKTIDNDLRSTDQTFGWIFF